MRGVSRTSLAELRDQLAGSIPGPVVAELTGDELFAVTRLLSTEHGLRRALADPAKPGAEKSAIVTALIHGKVSPPTEEMTAKAAGLRWATPGDFTDALEELAIESYVMAAGYEGNLDDLEDDLFRFARVIAGQPDLRVALTGAAPEAAKRDLVHNLLDGKVSGPAEALITRLVTYPRGRSPQGTLENAATIAARYREQLLATVRVATPLASRQRERLRAALQEAYGHPVHLNVVLDPAIIGGMSVQIGDELIDGTSASRLAEVRRRLAS
jgi:F-type H+-transporting ATPase subunit delta